MRKLIPLLLIMVCIVGWLLSCSTKNDNDSIVFSFDKYGNYLGFANLPEVYTIDDANNDGYYVKKDLKVAGNREVWDNFIETVANGENIGIRIVSFYIDDDNTPYFNDLFYYDGYYYLFDNTSENQEKQSYSYLLILNGRFGNARRDSGIIVLTDDNTLTFNKVMKSLLSSDLGYIQSVSPYRLVMFE